MQKILIAMLFVLSFNIVCYADDIYYVVGRSDIFKEEPYKETTKSSPSKLKANKDDRFPKVPLPRPPSLPLCKSTLGEQVKVLEWGKLYTKVHILTGPCANVIGYIENSGLSKYIREK
jgi:hypothetical protein